MKYHNIISRGGRPIIHVYEKVSDAVFTRDEIRIHDNIDIPFVPYDKILGSWSVCDLVDTPDEFNPLIRKCPEKGLFVKNAEFLPDGKALRIQDNGTAHLCWTKGFVISKNEQTASMYEIRNINGREFLFTEWKSGDYIFGGKKPCWYVFTRK